MKLKFIGITAIVLVSVITLGCVESQSSAPSINYNPTNIKEFSIVNDGEVMRLFFFLENSQGQNTIGDGEANLQIKDSANKTVFTQQFNFRAIEFVDYQFILTGQKMGKAYEWRLNQKDITKGISKTGTAELIITTLSGNVMKATDSYIQIPSYTEEEIKQMYSDQFNKNAIISGEVIKKGNFEVTLVKYGFFTHLKYDTLGDEVTDFRVDLKIKNIASEKDSFRSYDAVILSGTNQYERSYNSKLESSDIYPGIVKEGYIIFEDIPETLVGQIKIIAGTSLDDSYNKLTYEYIVKISSTQVKTAGTATQVQVVSTSSATSTPTYVKPVVVATPTGIITTLKIMNFKFSTLNVQINAGDEVLWNNFDENYYTIVELDNKIANITLKGTGRASYIFNWSGSYKFGLYYQNKGDSYLCTTSNQCMSTSIQNIDVLT